MEGLAEELGQFPLRQPTHSASLTCMRRAALAVQEGTDDMVLWALFLAERAAPAAKAVPAAKVDQLHCPVVTER